MPVDCSVLRTPTIPPIFAYRGIYIPLLCSYRGGSQGPSPTYEQAHVGLDLLTLASFYYDMKEWDAAIDLYDMMGIKAEVEKYPLLKQYISNYHINLIDAERIEKPEMFRTDLHEVLGMLRYRGDKSGLQTYVNDNESYFSNLDQDSYYAIGSFLKSKRLLKKIEADNQGRKEIRLNMCKALEELYEDGIEQGKRDTAINLKRMGLTLDQIAQAVEENVSVVRVWLEGSKLKK